MRNLFKNFLHYITSNITNRNSLFVLRRERVYSIANLHLSEPARNDIFLAVSKSLDKSFISGLVISSEEFKSIFQALSASFSNPKIIVKNY